MPAISVKFEPRDLWVGIYWRYFSWDEAEFFDVVSGPGARLEVFVCILPCFPIILRFGDAP